MSAGRPWVLSLLLCCATALGCPDRRVLGARRGGAALRSDTSALAAQPDRGSSRSWASLAGQRLQAVRDVPYRTIDGQRLKLDLYVPYDRKPGPTVFYIHGGGWQGGSKEQYVLWYLPYFELGLRVVAVQYRLSGQAPAPAGVEDCRCALRWVVNHAAEYGIDPRRVVVTGGSAGGHLALLTAFGSPGFEAACPEAGREEPQARAVINYYGATDLVSLWRRGDPSLRKWFQGTSPPEELAFRLSPLTLVRPGLPPVLTLHGDADKVIPYDQAVRLHEALTAKGVPNQLLTVRGGTHGRHTWTDSDTLHAQQAIERFLRRHHILTAALP
jgi:acetyl esterase/lipase